MNDTLIHPRQPTTPTPATGVSRPSCELPPDILRQATKRLRVLALTFAFVFFMAGFFAPIVMGYAESLFARFAGYGPGTISILVALLVFGLTFHRGISPHALMNLGLAFGAAGSFGIACAEYIPSIGRLGLDPEGFYGLSWVAVWTLFFTIVIPNKPWRSFLAALISVIAVPLVVGFASRHSNTGAAVKDYPVEFFFAFVFPYLLIVVLAYVGARVLHKLGTAVTRARELGSYRLMDLIGKGGMGEVWRAKHRMLARPAAIKLVRPEALTQVGSQTPEHIIRRFEREAQATATMRSPHTIIIYDFGISNDGVFYYVMELLDGYDLKTLVSRIGPLPPERVTHLLRQVCHSLAEAHQHGLIHRDIKPANVFTCRHGGDDDFVKVLDFGLVKLQREGERGDVQLTAENVASGTPGYMAPEQILGDRPVDARTDIYALGCLGYYLLTGQDVFHGESSMKIMMQHVQEKPVPPSERSEERIPEALEAIVLQCLEKDPDQRVQSASELAQRLDGCGLAQSWTPDRAREWWDTHQPPARPSPSDGPQERVRLDDATTR